MIQQDKAIFGKVFKEIRLSKNISTKDACNEICTSKTLYNFENGKNCLNVSTLSKILKNINISEEDYFAAVRDYQPNINDTFFQNIVDYHLEKKIFMLKKMLQKLNSSKNKEDKLRTLMIMAIINDLDKNFIIPKQDLTNASDYLIGINKWGHYELELFSYVVDILNIKLATSIVREFINNKRKFGIDRKKEGSFN
ncbi:MAG: hypothetical protein LBL38_02490 [Lactobacillales bacterium]|nr:hypothetical protein [Lactobacillales bacterium]